MTTVKLDPVKGAKGGGGGGSVSMPDDTLRSEARIKIIDAISEGPITSLEKILINKTDIAKFPGAVHQFRAGQPSDTSLEGFDQTEAYQSVGADFEFGNPTPVRTIANQNIDSVKIDITVGKLFNVTNKGVIEGAYSGWYIEVLPAGGTWQEVVRHDIDYQKISSPVQFQDQFKLPGSGPWDVRLRPFYNYQRSGNEEVLNWAGMSLVTDGKLTYPNTAIVGLELPAKQIGSSLPDRHYQVKGRIVKVPSNYDSVARTYTGAWDGTFKTEWTNNPAWIFYDLVDSNVFGLRDQIEISTVNKWRLYTIAQYCDQQVPSGYSTEGGAEITEPRYTFNGVITNKRQALDALRSITAVWRGMGFYSQSQIHATADMPQDPAFIYGPSNVLDGRFEYSTSSVKARHSVVLVRFNDPDNLFEPAVEAVVDDDLIRQFGWREKSVQLAGCSSRSLARRYGKWIIDTEKNETETVAFSVSMDSIHAMPGEVIAVSDPRRVRARLSGRLVGVTDTATKKVTLDAEAPVELTGPISLRVQKSDGTMIRLEGTIDTDRASITITSGALDGVRNSAVYILSSVIIEPKLFRIISIEEDSRADGGSVIFSILGMEYDSTKFARVEQGILFEPPKTSLPDFSVAPPTNLIIQASVYTTGGQVRTDIEIGWTPPVNTMIKTYRVFVDTPTRTGMLVGETSQNSITHSTFEPGLHKFYVYALSYNDTLSEALEGSYTAEGASAIDVGAVQDLVNAATLVGGNTTFTGRDVRVSWRNMMHVSNNPAIVEVESDDAIYGHTTLEVYHGPTKVRTERVRGNTFIYTHDMNKEDALSIGSSFASRNFRITAKVVDTAGRVSPASEITLTNAPPSAIAPTISVVGREIQMSWPQSTDEDVAGYMVWVRDNNGPVSGHAPEQVLTSNTSSYRGAKNSQYWVSVAAFDAFDRSSLNYATPVLATTSFDGSELDVEITDQLEQAALDAENALFDAEEALSIAEDVQLNVQGIAQDAIDQAEAILQQTIAASKSVFSQGFNNGADYWIDSVTQDRDEIDLAPAITSRSSVSLVSVADIGQVLQADGSFSRMSERTLRLFVQNRKYRLTVRTRILQNPSAGAGLHTREYFIAGVNQAGISTPLGSLGVKTGQTSSDGWFDDVIEFDAFEIRDASIGGFGDAVEWRVAVGLNGTDSNVGGAIQQVAWVTLDDITAIKETEGLVVEANSAKIAAETAAGQSLVRRDEAVSAKEDAESAASSAFTSLTLSARTVAQSGGVLDSQYLDNDSGWSNYFTGPTYSDNSLYPQGRDANWNIGSSTTAGIVLQTPGDPGWVGQKGAKSYYIEVEFTLNSGSLGGAGVMLDWMQGSTDRRDEISLSDMVDDTVVTGRVTTARAVFQRPSGASSSNEMRLYFMASFSGSFGTRASKNITLHRIYVRVATEEEVGGGVLEANLSDKFVASTDMDTAIAAQITTLQASVSGGLTASVTSNKAAVSSLSGYASSVASLTAELSNGKIAGIRATTHNGSGGATSTSLLELLGDNVIAEGTMSVNKLRVGLGSNEIANVRPSIYRLLGWQQTISPSNTDFLVRETYESWADRNDGSFYLFQNSSGSSSTSAASYYGVVSASGGYGDGIPVTPGEYIEFQARLSAHRCSGYVEVEFRRSSGSLISTVSGTIVTNSPGSSTNVRNWDLSWLVRQVPANAAYAVPRIIKTGTSSGQSDSYLFFARPMFADTYDGRTASPFQAPSGTYIDSNGLRTNAVTADKVAAEVIRAKIAEFVNLSAVQLTADNASLGTASVTTLKIGENEVTVPAWAGGFYSATATISVNVPTYVIAIAHFVQGSGKAGHFWRLRIDGAQVAFASPTDATVGSLTGGFLVQPGTRTVSIACDTLNNAANCGVAVFAGQR